VAKLPDPQLPLPRPSTDEVLTLDEGQRVWRVYRAGGGHPVTWSTFRTFGPVATGRFDHHEPPAHDDPNRGIMYGSLDIPGAIAEAFGDTRLIDRWHDGPWLVGFELDLDLVLLDLRGPWPTRAGTSQAIATGRRDRAQAWSRAIHAAFPDVHGLLYRSAMAGGSTNIALYERAVAGIPRHPILHLPLSHAGLEVALDRVANRFGYAMS